MIYIGLMLVIQLDDLIPFSVYQTNLLWMEYKKNRYSLFFWFPAYFYKEHFGIEPNLVKKTDNRIYKIKVTDL
jgi:hypothetical protein